MIDKIQPYCKIKFNRKTLNYTLYTKHTLHTKHLTIHCVKAYVAACTRTAQKRPVKPADAKATNNPQRKESYYLGNPLV